MFFTEILENVHNQKPLIHCITNYVSANDCANVILARGGSPIMADCSLEVAEITAKADALLLNTGLLNAEKCQSMLLAGKIANKRGIPVILDPVGVGTSHFRHQFIVELLDTINFAVIRGNSAEIQTLATGLATAHGIDTPVPTSSSTLEITQYFSRLLHNKTRAIIVTSGIIDCITYADGTYALSNGHSSMCQITGTGCMLSSMIATYCGASPHQLLPATFAAVGTMSLSGEQAYAKVQQDGGGTGSLRVSLIDAINLMTHSDLEGGLNHAFYPKHA